MAKITAAITGVGQYLPDYILTNEELSKMVDTSDEWIMSHIGVKTRHILKGEGVGTSYMGARAIIAIAGMEGALASVIGGLVDCPVIAVPTSVGYGASFGGVAALLSMLNSCASGVSVVNIDNGFGAGYLASMINHMGAKP